MKTNSNSLRESKIEFLNSIEAMKEDVETLIWIVNGPDRSSDEIRNASENLNGWYECIKKRTDEYLEVMATKQFPK